MIPVHLQPESHVPLYIQLRDQLRALVNTGELRLGDRLPASREFAVQLGKKTQRGGREYLGETRTEPGLYRYALGARDGGNPFRRVTARHDPRPHRAAPRERFRPACRG